MFFIYFILCKNTVVESFNKKKIPKLTLQVPGDDGHKQYDKKMLLSTSYIFNLICLISN